MSTFALPEQSASALGQTERVLYTFTAPSRTMADLRRNASWWVPWLLVSVVSVAFVLVLDKKIGWAQVMETQNQTNPKAAERIDKMAPDQRANMMKIQTTVARGIGFGTPVIMLLTIVVVAAVLVGLFNFGFGTKLRFGEMMGVAAYSYLPSLINSLLIIMLMFFVEPDAFDIKYPIATNPGYFIPATMPFWKTLLGGLDIFSLWTIFLMAVGVSQLSKVKKGTAFGAILGLLLTVKLIAAGLSAM